MQRRLNSEHANTIAEKARRIVTDNNSLTHAGLIELFETLYYIAASIFTAHNFKQTHVTHGIEKMRYCELLSKRNWHVLDQQ